MARPVLSTVNEESNQFVGLESFWSFGSADSPTLTDFSGNGATGINTDVSLTSDGYFGTVGVFDRTLDSRFEFAGSPQPGLVTDEFTFSTWVKADWSGLPDGESNNMRLLCRRDAATGLNTLASGWIIDFEAQGDGTAVFRLVIRSNISGLPHYDSRILTVDENNTWLHLCATWKEGEAPEMYVNGDPSGSNLSAGVCEDIKIGASDIYSIGVNRVAPLGFPPTPPFWAHGLTGRVAEMRLYNRSLTADEVSELYDVSTRWELYNEPPVDAYRVRRNRTFFYDPMQFKGYNPSIDYGGTELPDYYDVTGSFTKADHWLQSSGPGQIVYNEEFEHSNFAVFVLMESLDESVFAIQSRYSPTLSVRAEFDFSSDILTLEEYGSTYPHSIETSFDFVDNTMYILSLWALDDTFYVWINDYQIASITTGGLTSQTFALDFVSGITRLHKVRVYELLDSIAPSREDEISNTLVQYRKFLQDELADVTAQNWAAFKKAHNRYRFNRNIGARNSAWESMGYPVPKPSTDAFFND